MWEGISEERSLIMTGELLRESRRLMEEELA
jgi:hypothetical protein